MDSPPPKRIITPHGNFSASFHVIRALSRLLDGIINMREEAIMAIAVSLMPGINLLSKKGLVIQAIAIPINTMVTAFSSQDMLPIDFSSFFIFSLPIGIFILVIGMVSCVRKIQQTTRVNNENGRAKLIQLAKENSVPYNCLAVATKIGFVGVPTNVATPPMDAE